MVWFAYIEEGYAAEQDNQYCDISSTTIITTDQDGNIINNQTEEKVVPAELQQTELVMELKLKPLPAQLSGIVIDSEVSGVRSVRKKW